MILFHFELRATLTALFTLLPTIAMGGGSDDWWHHGYDDYYYSSDSSSSDSSSDSHDHDDFYDTCGSVAEIACDGDYDIFCMAIKEVGLYDHLDDNHEHFSAFFPTDTAFDELLDSLHADDIRDIPTHTLEDIVLMHFTYGHYLYESDLKHRCTYLLKMANDDDTRTICKDDARKLFQKGSGNVDDDRPRIVKFDVEACNGVIHTVDEVILPGHMAPKPKCQSIVEIVCDDNDFDVLCHALIFTDLDDDLGEDEWTVFAPTDRAFHEMMDRFHLDSITELEKEKLTEVLLYHVVPEALKFHDIHCGDELEMASGECSRTHCNRYNGHKFQRGTCNRREYHNVPRIIQRDVEACNGYVQVVEDVLLPEALCHP